MTADSWRTRVRSQLPDGAVYGLKSLVAMPFARRLSILARIHGTDKRSPRHDYTSAYEEHFRARRRSMQSVLEIGVGGYGSMDGGSGVRMWRSYFPNAHIVGVDIHEKSLRGRRLHFMRGSQEDSDFLQAVARAFGPFDLVVDDGSHINRAVLTSFDCLFPWVKPDGFYVIEDLETAYDPKYGGGPPGTTGSSVELLKQLVDSVNHSWLADHGHAPPRRDDVAALAIYPGLGIVRKSGRP